MDPNYGDDPGSVSPGTPGTENLPTVRETAAVLRALERYSDEMGQGIVAMTHLGPTLDDLIAACQRVRAVTR